MIVKTVIVFLAAGALAMGSAGMAPLQTSTQTKAATSAVLLAQTDEHKEKKPVPKTVVKKPTVKKFSGPKPGPKKFTGTKNTVKKTTVIKRNAPNRGVKTGTKFAAPKTTVKVIHPKLTHSKQVTTRRLRGLSATGVGHATIRGRNYSTWRHGRYRRRYHNEWVTFLPLSMLAALLIDDQEYYAYAYIDAPEDYCFGGTEDGCQLVWDQIETMEGELVGQCVAYCPWQD